MSSQTIHILEGTRREPAITELVDALGYEVHDARDRGELVRACREVDEVDLVALDELSARAVGPDGDALLDELADAHADVLVSIREPGARPWVFEHGAVDYIVEPFIPAELMQRISSVLGPPLSGASPRVLLATEDEMVRGMLEPSFDKQGWDLLQTDSGKEALAITEEDQPDVVLIDSGLRFCSAFDFLEDVAEMEHTPEVVVLTDGAPEADVVRAFDLGAGDVIDRPYAPQVVLARTRRLLGQRGGRS